MAVDVSADLERAFSDLREIDSDLAMITGRRGNLGSLSDRINRKRPAPNFASRISFDGNERRVQEVGDGRRIRISVGNEMNEPGGRLTKRIRYSDNDRDARDTRDTRASRGSRNFHDEFEDDDDRDPPPRRSIQSSVVMPTIETKSREVVLSEMKKKEKKEDVARNRNLFGRLLVGTLKQFQKEEKAVQKVETVQAQKQKEVEKRLEANKKEDAEKVRYEKEELLSKRREKEKEIQKLKRQKAITQYAEEKITHYKRLQNYVQTQTKPPLFYLPAKHTLRTLELLKNSSKKIDTLIEKRREQMEKELKKDAEGSDDELDVPIRSKVIAPGLNKADEVEAPNIEDLEEPKLEEDEPEEKEVVKVHAESPANRNVEIKVNGEKPAKKPAGKETGDGDRGYSSGENGVSNPREKERNSRDRSRSRHSSTSSSSSGSDSESGSSSSGESAAAAGGDDN